MTDDRPRRPELERTGPRRDTGMWSGRAGDTTGGGTTTAGEKSVSSAYDVIDRYMKEGQRVASKFGEAYADLNLSENVSEMQARWFELTGELMANWFDLLGTAGDRISGGTDDDPGRRAGQPGVVFDVRCGRWTRLSARFVPGAQRFQLTGPQATADNEKLPGIPWEAVTKHGSDTVRIRARIRAKQPPGRYTANVINAHSGEILGSLSIEVM